MENVTQALEWSRDSFNNHVKGDFSFSSAAKQFLAPKLLSWQRNKRSKSVRLHGSYFVKDHVH